MHRRDPTSLSAPKRPSTWAGLGLARLHLVRLHLVRLGLVRLGLVRLGLVGLCAACMGAGDAASQPPPQPPPQPPNTTVAPIVVRARRPTVVAGIEVVALCPLPSPARHAADHDPKVIDSFPAQGAHVPPGVIYVRVRFDAPMTCDWDVAVIGEDGVDPCDPAGAWAMPARRSFVTRCVLRPNRHYDFRFGNKIRLGFVGLSGRQAERFKLAFDTTAGPTSRAILAGAPDPEPVFDYVTCMGVDAVQRGAPPTCQRALVSQDGPPDLSVGADPARPREPPDPGPPPE